MAGFRVGDKASGTDRTPQGSAAKKNPPQAQFLRPTRWQFIAGMLVAPMIWLIAGSGGTVAFVGGALCSALPQAYFGLRMQRAARQGAARAARIGLAAEGGKFLLSAVSFALIFAVIKPEQPGLVFLGFGAFWLVQTVATATLLRTG